MRTGTKRAVAIAVLAAIGLTTILPIVLLVQESSSPGGIGDDCGWVQDSDIELLASVPLEDIVGTDRAGDGRGSCDDSNPDLYRESPVQRDSSDLAPAIQRAQAEGWRLVGRYPPVGGVTAVCFDRPEPVWAQGELLLRADEVNYLGGAVSLRRGSDPCS